MPPHAVTAFILVASLASGAAMALGISPPLERFGAISELGQIIALTSVRETAPLITMIIVTLAAATKPAPSVSHLPAMLVVMPMLTALSVFGVTLGGYLAAAPSAAATYWSSAWLNQEPALIAVCLWKALTFAAILIAILSARSSRGNRRWTPAALLAIPLIPVAHYLITRFAILALDLWRTPGREDTMPKEEPRVPAPGLAQDDWRSEISEPASHPVASVPIPSENRPVHLLRRFTAWLPIALSAFCLTLIAAYLSTHPRVPSGTAHDEGPYARLFQLGLLLQVPAIGHFALSWLPREPRPALAILALQLAAAALAIGTIYWLEH